MTSTIPITTNNNDNDNENITNDGEKTVYDELIEFLQTPRRPDLRLEAAKAVLQVISSSTGGHHDRLSEALKLVQDYNVVQPLLKLVSAGTYTEPNNHVGDDDDATTKTPTPGSLAADAAEVSLQALLYLTSSTDQLVNLCTDRLLDPTVNAVPRLVEFILTLPAVTPMTSNNNNKNSNKNKNNIDKTNRRINLALALLANLSRSEAGALALTGFALPEEAVYNNPDDDNDTNHNSSGEERRQVRIKPTMELLLDRFLNPNLIDTNNQEIVDYTMMEPHEWDGLFYDPYQHFGSVLMNIVQTSAGREFLLRIPNDSNISNNSTKLLSNNLDRIDENNDDDNGEDKSKTTTTTTTQEEFMSTKKTTSTTSTLPTVLERLVPILRANNNATTDNDGRYQLLSQNPLRRRGISGLIRNIICLSPDSVWWLMNVVHIITPILLPLVGPEELEWDDKKGMDPDLWLNGPNNVRDVDSVTRQHCVESILLLCAAGRKARETLRLARTYVILRQADMVEESEQISERIAECVQYLRRDEEGTAEGSSDQSVADAYGNDGGGVVAGSDGKIRLAIEAAPSTRVTLGMDEDDFDAVD